MTITAYCITVGESTTAECLKRLDAQTYPCKVVAIENIYPMATAFQKMIYLCDTDYFIQVDADMLLNPDAIDRLASGIKASNPRTAIFAEWLWGDFEQFPIGHIKIFRSEIIKQFSFKNKMFIDSAINTELREQKYEIRVAENPHNEMGCVGAHISKESKKRFHNRWYRIAKRTIEHPVMMQWALDVMLNDNGDPWWRIARDAFIAGMFATDENVSSDVSKNDYGFKRLVKLGLTEE